MLSKFCDIRNRVARSSYINGNENALTSENKELDSDIFKTALNEVM